MGKSDIVGLAVAAIVLVLAAIIVLTSYSSDLDLRVQAQDESLRISHRGVMIFDREDVIIRYDDILEVRLVEDVSSIRRVRGTNTPVVSIGRYRSEQLGEFRAYVLRQQGPHLYIRTSREAYLLTPVDAVSLYSMLGN